MTQSSYSQSQLYSDCFQFYPNRKKSNKKKWNNQQINLLFTLHKKYGNQWKNISNHFSGKKPMDIKNKFYSNLKRKLRMIQKALGNKHGSYEVRTIQPLVLSKIFDQSEKYENSFGKELNEIIFKFDETKRLIQDKQKNVLRKLIQRIYQINDQYKKQKKNKYQIQDKNKKNLRSSKKNKEIIQVYKQKHRYISFLSDQSQNQNQQNDQISLGIIKQTSMQNTCDKLQPINLLKRRNSFDSRISQKISEISIPIEQPNFLFSMFELTPVYNLGESSYFQYKTLKTNPESDQDQQMSKNRQVQPNQMFKICQQKKQNNTKEIN